MSDAEKEPVVQYADNDSEAIRSISHVTRGAQLPAPLVYSVLRNLKGVGYLLLQALKQLSSGLGRSLNEYTVTEDDGRDPVQSVATATDHLTRAAELATQLGDELEKAQSAIARQSYKKAPNRELGD